MDDKAKKRWQILAKVIKSKKPVAETTKRKFQTYQLIVTEQLHHEHSSSLHSWHRVHCVLLPDLQVQVRLFKSSFSLSDLAGFNNTGNVCIWPSEECLAFYCLQNRNQFSCGSVLELGGGMTCLAGLLLAKANVAREIHLTDGNSNAAGNLADMLEGDKAGVGLVDTKVSAGMLRWDDWEAIQLLKHKYDWVICADCLFFDSGREGLVDAIQQLLSPSGVALIVAPNREGTFTQFENSARRVFDVEVQTNYSPQIWEAHQKWLQDPTYQTDIHYPKLITLKNKSS